MNHQCTRLARARVCSWVATTVLLGGCGGGGGEVLDQGTQDSSVDSGPIDMGNDSLGNPPATFETHNVLFETFMGAWIGYVPDAYVRLAEVRADVGGQLVAVSLHSSDAFENPASIARLNLHLAANFPEGVVDAQPPPVGRDYWGEVINMALLRESDCGLAIDASSVAHIEVRAACEAGVEGEVRLNVWAVEAEALGPAQANVDNATVGHPYEGAGDPIVDFVHENVLRAFLTSGTEGEVVVTSAGTVSRFFDGSAACTDTDCTVVAFISVFDAVSGENHVVAVERATYGAVLPW